MKVYELISLLKDFSPEDEVRICHPDAPGRLDIKVLERQRLSVDEPWKVVIFGQRDMSTPGSS